MAPAKRVGGCVKAGRDCGVGSIGANSERGRGNAGRSARCPDQNPAVADLSAKGTQPVTTPPVMTLCRFGSAKVWRPLSMSLTRKIFELRPVMLHTAR